uniref:Uncharacterized protein n=1 Tax=Rhizophagus irregularis (strain DAOM 181602 / DAOM 197198 / MUCL 43194) TaxID=747089 RepID=U9UV34_RHIID
MIQSEASNGIVSPPITPTATCDSKFECNVCRKVFKNLDILPENTTRQFKGILVHYIHKKLPSGYKKLGKQTVSIPATESQFYAVFKDHIHYYSARKNIYKCIFHGVSANQILADILEMQEWGLNFMSNVNVLSTLYSMMIIILNLMMKTLFYKLPNSVNQDMNVGNLW